MSSKDAESASPDRRKPARRTVSFAEDSGGESESPSVSISLPVLSTPGHDVEDTARLGRSVSEAAYATTIVTYGSEREGKTSSALASSGSVSPFVKSTLTGSGGPVPGIFSGFGRPKKVPGLRPPGRSKSMNISAFLVEAEQDLDDDVPTAQSGPYASKVGAQSKKGFYATGQQRSMKQPPSPMSSADGSPARFGVEKKGFYGTRSSSPATTPRERGPLLASQLKGELRDEGDWATDRSSTFSGSSGRVPGSPGGDSFKGGASSMGSPSPRGSLESTGFALQSSTSGSVNTHAPKNAKRELRGAQFPKPFLGGLFWQPTITKAPLLPPLGSGTKDGPQGAGVGEQDRFDLLLLGEGEYYFKDYACHFHPQGGEQRYALPATDIVTRHFWGG